MNQFTWCAEVRVGTHSKILFGRVTALDGARAKEAIVNELERREYHIQRYALNGFMKEDPLQVNVLP